MRPCFPFLMAGESGKVSPISFLLGRQVGFRFLFVFTAMPKLLELLDVKGRIITADAMHTQRSAAEEVTRRGGDYVLALKGNQERLHDEVRFHFADPDNAEKMLFFSDLSSSNIELAEQVP